MQRLSGLLCGHGAWDVRGTPTGPKARVSTAPLGRMAPSERPIGGSGTATGWPIARAADTTDSLNVRYTDQNVGTRGVELSRRPGAARGTAIVRAGHPALDLALTSEANRHHAAPTLAAMRAASRPASPVAASADAPADTRGRSLDATSITFDRRTGATTTVHVAVIQRATGRDGRTRKLVVWHELAQQSWN